MRKFWAVLVLALSVGLAGLLGCGSSSDDTDVTPPAEDIRGTYKLTGFVVDLYYDAVCSSHEGTLTEDDLSSWSGTMLIGDTTITQTFKIEGYTFNSAGTYTVEFTGETYGILHITDGYVTYHINFTLDGFYLSTNTGCVEDAGSSYQEIDIWKKKADYAPALPDFAAPGRDAPVGSVGNAAVR